MKDLVEYVAKSLVDHPKKLPCRNSAAATA